MPLKYTNNLQGKRIVIVGGTSGIGFAAAEAAVEHGAIVVVASSKQEKVDSAVQRIQKAYPNALDRVCGTRVDLSSQNVEERIMALYEFATEAGKHKLDHVVLTMGDSFGPIPLANVTPQDILDVYQVRIIGSTILAKIAMRYLNISASSSFTLTSGVSDLKPTVGWTVMAPVGAALRGLTHALANDMKPVRVNCVCPGAVKTELFDNFAGDRLEEILDTYKAKTLTGSVGAPEDLAECYISVMKNKFMTGQEITADGGYLFPRTAPKPKDPNAPDYRYQVNQKCIYERRLPGGSYITAHVQRLQSGFYDSPVIHEDCIHNVRFVAINFVFHPSRSTFRFKSAEINIALRHANEDGKNPLQAVTALVPRTSSHDHGTQTETANNLLVRSKDCLHIQHGSKPSRPKFLRHAPHLLYGSISPETLNWNFNLAGSLGVSQGPASASLQPSYGIKSSYKVYEMMKIQGSVRTLRSWLGHEYDIEDGELVWTLEENKLQKSGLPREFTFVMLLTKGTGGFEESGDVRLEIDVHPKVMGRLGSPYPSLITNLHKYQPFKRGILDLDEEIGQVFEPHVKGQGFNFANIASNFDDFVWLPGNAYSTSEPQYSTIGNGNTAQQQGGSQQKSSSQPQQQQSSRSQQALPTVDNTLNLRVFLEPSQGGSVPLPIQMQQQVPHLNLKLPATSSRNQSPMPPSIAGSRNSKARRTITIGSTRSVRKQRSRSELAKEYRSSSSEQPKSEEAVPTEEIMLKRGNGPALERPFSFQEVDDGHHNRDGSRQTSSNYDTIVHHASSPVPEEASPIVQHSSPDYVTPPSHKIEDQPEWEQARHEHEQGQSEQRKSLPESSQQASQGPPTENGLPSGSASKRQAPIWYDNPPGLASAYSAAPLSHTRNTSTASAKDRMNRFSTMAAQRATRQYIPDHP
ncbi:hypothetical protein H2200_000724 [Cladophialophora chaetospira]|uniref:Uncharacterized protein n=1 Tax=Cladophialophora chaetospira TaxID=386627 RepID=A0AA39CR88_9EURO|nr:hypothetical protein H2200_000724 [Cladophialophora chaetospira]